MGGRRGLLQPLVRVVLPRGWTHSLFALRLRSRHGWPPEAFEASARSLRRRFDLCTAAPPSNSLPETGQPGGVHHAGGQSFQSSQLACAPPSWRSFSERRRCLNNLGACPIALSKAKKKKTKK